MIIFFWLIFSVAVGMIGSSRNIGFLAAFLLSLFLSPLIGLIFTLVSKDPKKEKYEKELLETQKEQAESLKNMRNIQSANNAQKSVTEQLEGLLKLKQDGHLSDEEYQKAKNKIIASFD